MRDQKLAATNEAPTVMKRTPGILQASANTEAVTSVVDDVRKWHGMGVYRAIQRVSREMAKYGISKDGKNAAQGFNFRGIDQVLNALSLPLVEHGLLILPRVTQRAQSERPTAKGGVMFDVVVWIDFDLVSVEDGSQHTVSMIGEASDSGDKATSKAVSMAFKYMVFDTFCVPVEGLDDADASTPAPTVRKATAVPVATAPAADETDLDAAADPYVTMTEAVKAAATLAELAALKIPVSNLRKHPQWNVLKALYTERNAELKGSN